jgi:hypothetical protein
MNQQLAIRIAKTDIQRILAVLALTPGLELDEQLKLSMLEGETGLFEVVSALLEENENDDGMIAALDAQVDARAIRIERAKARIEARKRAIMSLMDSAHETTLRLPEATLSLRTLKARPKVLNVDELPDEFVKTETIRKPDTDAINAAFERGQPIPGVTITNGGASLSVRRR